MSAKTLQDFVVDLRSIMFIAYSKALSELLEEMAVRNFTDGVKADGFENLDSMQGISCQLGPL